MNIIIASEPTEEELEHAHEHFAEWEKDKLIAHIVRVTKASALFTGYMIGYTEAATGSKDIEKIANAAEQMRIIFIDSVV